MFDVQPASAPASSTADARWPAHLALEIERRGQRSVLASVTHSGPLRVQKALYPESAMRAEVLVLHPPSGIAGGDELRIEVRLHPGAQARLTTPGATKWYRSRGPVARQDVHLQVGDGAVLEWLPQEGIVYDGARACTETVIECTDGARACGWDIWMLGRLAAGEHFARGELRQRLRLRRGGRLLWSERLHLRADDALRASPLGWNGQRVAGSFWALGLAPDESLLEQARTISEPGVHLGVTRFEHGLWLARALGDSAERVRTALTRLWALIRPALCGAAGTPPRIWAT